MLYIQKTQPSQDLLNWINAEKAKGVLHPQYSNLQSKNPQVSTFQAYDSLRKQLYDEQNGVCCYCMKIITPDNSNIEHFLPQSIFAENEVDYYNLYLACRYSHKSPKEKQHCDIAKGNSLIGKYIGYLHTERGITTKCEDLIQYTEDGYILPNKTGFKTLIKFYQNYSSLTAQEKELLGTIEILNLNYKGLVNERENFIKDEFKIKVIKSITDISRINTMISFYQTKSTKFAGVALYFLNERMKQLP